jgi:uncharacterized protein (DUF849 family)
MKTIITCAVTGGGAITERSKYVPITPVQIAESAIDAARAGAAIVHIHVRDPHTGAPSMEIECYRQVVERIRASGIGVLINLTTGVGARYAPDDNDPAIAGPGTNFVSPERRVQHVLDLRPEICSLDVGSTNFAKYVVINTPGHLSRMAALIRGAGVKPELEVFELGHIRYARKMIEDGEIEGPPLFQMCLGIPWAADASPNTMVAMKNMLPANAQWSGFGISTALWPMVAQAFLLGGNVRVGLEDSLYVSRGVLAPSNAVLVERAVAIIHSLGGETATAEEARQMLSLVRS